MTATSHPPAPGTSAAHDLLNAVVELRMEAIAKNPSLELKRSARTFFLANYTRTYANAYAEGDIELRFTGRRLDGLILRGPAVSEHTGKPTVSCSLDYRLDSAAARRWIAGAIRRSGPAFARGAVSFYLLASYRALLAPLYEAGVHIDSVVLWGTSRAALAALERRHPSLDWPLEYAIDPVRTESHVLAALALLTAEFTRNPQFGQFVTDPKFLERERQGLREHARAGAATKFVIQMDGRIVGYFGMAVIRQHPVWGSVGSPMLCFDPRFQGRGLSKYAYATLLRRMRALRVPTFIGHTAQPPTMRTGQEMEREVFSYSMRNGVADFPLSHFRYARR